METKPAPVRMVGNQEGLTSAATELRRQKAARPVTSKAADEVIEVKDFARPARFWTPTAIGGHAFSN